MSQYAVAYHDRDNKGLGSSPWVLDDLDSLDEAVERKRELLSQGFKMVTVFLIDSEDKRPELIGWEYVDERKVG